MNVWGRRILFIALGMALTGVMGIACYKCVYCMWNMSHYRLQFPTWIPADIESPIERDRYLKRFDAAADSDERWLLTDEYLYQYPISPFAISNKAYLLIEQGDAEEGIRLTRILLDLYGEQSNAYNNLGWAYNRLQQYELALHYADKAAASNGGKAAYRELVNRADAYQGLEQYEAALELYLQVMQEFPAEVKEYAPYCHRQLAETYKQMENNDACLQTNLEIFEMFPDNYWAFYDAAVICKDMGNDELLVKLGQEYAANNPDDLYVHSLIGSMLLDLEKYEQAAGFYITYAEKSDYPAYGYYQAAKAFVLAEDLELAGQYIAYCLEQEPDYLVYMDEPELWRWLDD